MTNHHRKALLLTSKADTSALAGNEVRAQALYQRALAHQLRALFDGEAEHFKPAYVADCAWCADLRARSAQLAVEAGPALADLALWLRSVS